MSHLQKALAEYKAFADTRKLEADAEYHDWEEKLRALKESTEEQKDAAVQERNKAAQASAQIPSLTTEAGKS